jgi:uncharacterized protein (TIGR00299 family) protein
MIAYFDCFSGISGDMTLGALVDLGVPAEWIEASLKEQLPLNGFHLEQKIVQYHGLTARRIIVHVDEEGGHRDYRRIRKLIEDSRLQAAVKEKALHIFGMLAAAEAKIHGCDIESVHFHEVGGVDAIVDIVGVSLGIHRLGIKTIAASTIPTGSGFVNASHGRLPVPAPATLELLKNVPIYDNGVPFELVTPTGAAIVAGLADRFGQWPAMQIRKIGYGAGARDIESAPNLLRIAVGDPAADSETDIWIVETCIDDMNPELFGYLMERLFADGALDVYWIPVYMKKNRPGTMVQVLCHSGPKKVLIDRILSESTSTGVRYYPARRTVLQRSSVNRQTSFGEVTVKRLTLPDGTMRHVPEFEVCKKIAVENNLPLKDVYERIIKEAN